MTTRDPISTLADLATYEERELWLNKHLLRKATTPKEHARRALLMTNARIAGLWPPPSR